LKHNQLGRSGLSVSDLCFGCMTFGNNQWGAGNLNEKESTELVSIALDGGINFFDTADAYAFGESETFLGKALQKRRDKAVIATKVRIAMSDDPNDGGLSRRHILKSCEASLKRLGTDRIDLYQIHGWDYQTPFEETLAALDQLVKQGKVIYIGASNLAAWQLAKGLGLQRENIWARFVSLQPYYSLACRDIEHELVPLCLDSGVGILPWSPLAGGLLSGKYRHGGTGRKTGPLSSFPPVDMKQADQILDVLEQMAEARHAGCAEIALAWTRMQPGISSVIIGARTPEQLKANLKASAIELTQAELEALDRASRLREPYPQWMIRHQNSR